MQNLISAIVDVDNAIKELKAMPLPDHADAAKAAHIMRVLDHCGRQLKDMRLKMQMADLERVDGGSDA